MIVRASSIWRNSNQMLKKKRKKTGRPITRELKIDATPEEVAQAIFRAAKKPDPDLQKKSDVKSD